MTSTNDKVRSLILAALMVMSVFAGTVAFTGTAAAATYTGNNASLDPSTVSSGDTEQHDIAFEIDDISADGGTDTIEIKLPAGEFVSEDDLTVTDRSDGSEVEVTGSPEIVDSGSTLTFDISPDSAENVDIRVEATATVNHAEVEEDVTEPITLDVTDSGGAELSDEEIADVTIRADDVSTVEDGDLVYRGEQITFTPDSTPTGEVVLVQDPEDDDDTVRALPVNDDGSIDIDTSNLEKDKYVVEDRGVDEDSDDRTLINFEVIEQSLETEFADEKVDNDETTDLEVDSTRVEDFDLIVEADGASTSTLEDIFGVTANDDDEVIITASDEAEIEADFTDVSADDYEFNFTVVDTEVESSAAITVTKAGTADLDLNESSSTVESGDATNITVNFDETSDGYVRIGEDDIGYNVTWEVVDEDEDGVANFSFNSYNTESADGSGLMTADGDDASATVVTDAPGDDDFTEETVSGALDAGNYPIEAANNIEDLDSAPDAVGTLAITERSTTSAQPWVTHSDALSDIENGDDVIAAIEAGDVTQQRDVAQRDFAVVQFQVSGIFGYLEDYAADNDGDYAGAFGQVDTEDPNEPVSLAVSEADPGPNQQGSGYDLEDLTYVLDDERNMLFVVVPTTGSDVEVDNRYNATLEVNADSELNDAKTDERVSANFRIVDREAPLNTNADDNVEIAQSEDGEVTGTTTIAPGSEITVRVRSVSGAENPFVMSETVNVSSDGTYNATFDFADTPVGTNFTASVSASPSLDGEDEFDGIVVEQVDTESPTPTETPTETPTPTDTPEDGTDTPEDGTDTPTPEDTDTTTTTTPGFGAVVAVLALLGAALLALRRD
jgi:surface glycoprotein (TIGR04207 family)/PGF-CTERM protein